MRRVQSLSLRMASMALALTTVFLAAPTMAGADTIKLTNGNELIGHTKRVGQEIVITSDSGAVVRVAASRVREIVAGDTPLDTLRKREAAIETGDAIATWRLADWAHANGMEKDATRLYWQTLEIDSDHRRARERLGFRKLGSLWLTEADYQRYQGKQFFEGQWRFPEEHAKAVVASKHAKEMRTGQRLFRAAAGKGSDANRQAALDEFRELPSATIKWTLLKALESSQARERQFAVREFAHVADGKYARRLAHVAVTDRKRSVRDEALNSLKTLGDKDIALAFVPYLSSGNAARRINATRALNVFPDRRAAGELIKTAHAIWAGFGRAYISVITQRAFVSDYELVSGGTGLVVSEVADPVIDTFQEGVVLDVDITKAEAFSTIAALQRSTGQNFGTNLERWASWWKENAGKVAANDDAGETPVPASGGTADRNGIERGH